MSYQTILVTVRDLAVDAPALDAAVRLADARGAHLDVFCVAYETATIDVVAAGAGVALMQSAIGEARAQADALAKEVDARIAPQINRMAVQPVVLPSPGTVPSLARVLRYGDLAVAAAPYTPRAGADLSVPVEAALFGADVPVLVVSEGQAVGTSFRRIMICWNESDEAMAAVRAALPLLKEAEQVDIVMVDPPSHSPERSDPGGALCLMLARHGVKAEVSILARTVPNVTDVLTRFGREHDVDLAVIGAYGHSRLREAILGGVTRDLLGTSPFPVFLAR